ncbi:tyrosine-type recombinase/integrase [Paenibacillus sp. FSL H8-0034]|uniref:tyrosine-type recombinase/integrase n=1 Tax=Paenibacillus sp. FSL H8-0034 TaxID=2954671 RepID=UPI0030F9A3AB
MASIQKRGENSWLLVVEIGSAADGTRQKKTRTVRVLDEKLLKTPKRLQNHLNDELLKFKMEVEVGEYIDPSKMTFAAFAEEWREKHGKKGLSPNTLETYTLHLNKRLIPTFGHLRLDQIKPMQIVNFMHSLEQDGSRGDGKEGKLSSGTIEYIYRILKNIFSRAVDWQIIKTNPMEAMKKPRVETKEVSVYDPDEALDLFTALEKEPLRWQVMISLALTTGLRRGELLGLEWNNVKFEEDGRCTISVKQALVFLKGGGFIVKEPKTKGSKREVSVPTSLVPDLKALKLQEGKNRLQSGELWEGGDRFFIFTAWDSGKPLNPSSVKTWWTRFIKRNKLKYITFHSLRHTSATLLINEGVHAKIISERLGHSNIMTTMNIYGHVLKKADQEAANKFDTLLKPRVKNEGKQA